MSLENIDNMIEEEVARRVREIREENAVLRGRISELDLAARQLLGVHSIPPGKLVDEIKKMVNNAIGQARESSEWFTKLALHLMEIGIPMPGHPVDAAIGAITGSTLRNERAQRDAAERSLADAQQKIERFRDALNELIND